MNFPKSPGSYGSEASPRPQAPNFGFLLVLGALALLVYSQYQTSGTAQRGPSMPNIPQPGQSPVPSTEKNWRDPERNARDSSDDGTLPARGGGNEDWSMEEIDTVAAPRSGQNSSPSFTTNTVTGENGDWSIEVRSGRDESLSAGRPEGKPGKSENGDWSIEE